MNKAAVGKGKKDLKRQRLKDNKEGDCNKWAAGNRQSGAEKPK